ncbi:MAG TPA: ribosome recycling factor [Candidatus Obscuribacter sp.]|nr:ribosome recycling factor [Candidatus Melainabacteria bacterium]MBK8221228.1 ribosome recycling factor [Candidatus Obscuribacter sp.]MBK9279825.1 ribosome recycling factor [Candidatus Obscuribacter sp.]MBL8082616.1 ribosome recycling factor [Candidatus Obscuribacter sp.]MDX1986256.1 ribosome recycling factor [Candidatus Obscuribacter sp.]
MTTTTEVMQNADEHMKKALARLHKELQTVRTGRANPQMLDRIEADYYGTMTPLKGLANISTPDGRSLVIQPYDKGSLKAIEQAIHKSDLGVNPNSDGSVIRITFPQLTEERRKEMIKMVNKIGEEFRVAVRNARRDADQDLKKMKGEISEDEIKRQMEALQKLTDKHIKEIDKTLQDKEAELMEV